MNGDGADDGDGNGSVGGFDPTTNPYEDILLPTDGSEGIAAAATHAANIADRFDATVHVLSVIDTRNRFESPASGLSAEVWADSERDRARAAVADTVAALPDSVTTEAEVRSGVPRSEIIDHAENEPTDLIVMGTHGRTGLDHYLIGSVAEKVVRRSPVPVVTVRLNGD